jgi:GT2 family glycosyltransferase
MPIKYNMDQVAHKVTISLLTWNGAKYLPVLLHSLQNQTFKDWELLVLDNASVDNSVALVEEYWPPATIIKQKQNIGFARGHNLLVKWSKSEYVLVLNQDVILDPDYIETLVNFLDKHPKVASVSGKIFYWDFEENKKTTQIDTLGLKMFHNRRVEDWLQGAEDRMIEDQEVFGLSAVAVLYRRAALESVRIPNASNDFEYFDEDFFSYKEDIDLAWRLRLWSWQNYLVSNTKAYHDRTLSNRQSLKVRRKYRGLANKLSYRNHFLLLYKNSFWKNYFKDWHLIFWYEFKKFIYLLIFERSTLVGIKEFFKLLPKISKKRKYIQKNCHQEYRDIYNWLS